MKKLFLLAAALLVSFGAANLHAQDVNKTMYSLRFGAGISNITDGSESIGPKFSCEVGGTLNYMFAKKLAVSPGIFYTIKGAKGTYDYEGYDIDWTFKQQYLAIPLLLRYYFTSCDIFAGPYLGIKLKGEQTAELNGRNVTDNDGSLEAVDLGLSIGFEFFVTHNISLDARYNYGLSEI